MFFFMFFFFFLSIFFLFFIKNLKTFKIYLFLFMSFLFLFFLLSLYFYNFNTFSLYFYVNLTSIEIFQFGLDGISLIFLLLTTFFFPILLLCVWHIRIFTKLLFFFFFFLEFFLLMVFLTIDLFCFYVFFELILVPMIFIIGIWGSRFRRIKAIFYFFLYTFCGSLFLLFGLIILYFCLGNTNFLYLNYINLDFQLEKLLWLFFFFPFAIKIPMFPFYIWLPEAHVEAPTFGSVILAALLLKLGGFGFFKVLISCFFSGCQYFLPFVLSLSLIGLFYTSIILLAQIDLKKIIAYSSIAHMNYGILGLFSMDFYGIQGSFFLMLSHGFSSGALFILVGFLYEKYFTRLIFYFSGLSQIMPFFCFFFFFFSLANFGFPGTANFIGEFFILISFFNFDVLISFFLFFSLFLSLIYSMLLYVRLFFGNLSVIYVSFFTSTDFLFCDFLKILPLFLLIIFFGFFPTIIFKLLNYSIFFILIQY